MSRTFRTVGSGASQTTEPIENNKIPIYETKAAAEADIANLSDGQIIGTKDEGNENAKPVDVVEKGNMHAVTSNAVAEITSNHNGIFRGKCLNGDKSKLYPTLPIGNTNYLSGGGYTIEQVMTNIAAGNFADIYPGDYFIDSENKVYRIAGLDTEWNKSGIAQHHAIIVPDFSMTTMNWNSTDTTSGGYQGSAVYSYCVGAGLTAIESVFGADHILPVKEVLTDSLNTSAASPGYSAFSGAAASTWVATLCKSRLMSEVEVYGSKVWSGAWDIGLANQQFPLFRIMPQLASGIDYTYWLSGVATSSQACCVFGSGLAAIGNASNIYGVRPRFLVG